MPSSSRAFLQPFINIDMLYYVARYNLPNMSLNPSGDATVKQFTSIGRHLVKQDIATDQKKSASFITINKANDGRTFNRSLGDEIVKDELKQTTTATITIEWQDQAQEQVTIESKQQHQQEVAIDIESSEEDQQAPAVIQNVARGVAAVDKEELQHNKALEKPKRAPKQTPKHVSSLNIQHKQSTHKSQKSYEVNKLLGRRETVDLETGIRMTEYLVDWKPMKKKNGRLQFYSPSWTSFSGLSGFSFSRLRQVPLWSK